MNSRRRMRRWNAAAAGLAVVLLARASFAYIEAAHTLGRIVTESTNIVVIQVEKVDRERNLILYKKVRDLKGVHPTDVIRHQIGRGGFHPREWQFIMQETEVGRIAVLFHNKSASETCINNYWYQCYPGGDWWNLVHGEPYLMRSYYGKPEKLIPAVEAMLKNEEVVVTAMADGDKNALQTRMAKVWRMKASLKLMDYDAKRDFVGWGQQEFQKIDGWSGFSHMGTVNRVDPGAVGVAAADIDGDGMMDLCLYGEDKVTLLKSTGNMMEDAALPYSGGTRAAAFGDCNGDGKPDLLLATVAGPKLLVNEGTGKFKDDSARLPKESYYNLLAAAWIDADADGKQDILLANGFLGLRVYRNKSASEPFEDISDKIGLGVNGLAGAMRGDALAVADVNGDGRVDFLYTGGQTLLAINTPQGFVELKDHGLAIATRGAIPVFGDFNGDKAMDLFVPAAEGSRLFKNDGKGKFADVTAQSGDLAKPIPHAACAIWADLSKQGKPDLIVGCIKGSNRYFRNKGDGTFADAGEETGLYQRIFNTRAICVFDMNKDGVLDIAFNNEGQEPVVLLGATAQ